MKTIFTTSRLAKAAPALLAILWGATALADAPTDVPPQLATLNYKSNAWRRMLNRAPALPKKVRDPLQANLAVAIKDTPQKELNLPGVMKIGAVDKAALDFTRTQKIELDNGASKTVWLSATEPNRIQLPFNDPYIVASDALDINKRANTNNVYITFHEGVKTPIQIFFEPSDGGVTQGLQLVPKNIPSQTIIVVDGAGQTGARKSSKGSDYVANTQSLMETVALGGTPSGYSVIDIQSPPIGMNGLLVEPLKKLSSRDGDLYIYQVTNPGPHTATLRETEFDGENVSAVSINPKPLLNPGEKARVLVLVSKQKTTR